MEHEPEGSGAAEAGRPAVAVSRRGLVAGVGVGTVVAVVIALVAFRLGGGSGTAAAPSPTRSPSPTASAAPTVPEVFRRVGPSVVVIRAGDALGTGVIAADDSTILTAN